MPHQRFQRITNILIIVLLSFFLLFVYLNLFLFLSHWEKHRKNGVINCLLHHWGNHLVIGAIINQNVGTVPNPELNKGNEIIVNRFRWVCFGFQVFFLPFQKQIGNIFFECFFVNSTDRSTCLVLFKDQKIIVIEVEQKMWVDCLLRLIHNIGNRFIALRYEHFQFLFI